MHVIRRPDAVIPTVVHQAARDSLFDTAPVMLCAVSAGRIIRTNLLFRNFFRVADGAVNTDFLDLVAAAHRDRVSDWLHQPPDTGEVPPLEFSAVAVAGIEISCEATASRLPGDGAGTLVVHVSDITARKRAESELHHRAFHDALTGLPNRALLRDRFHQALAAAEREGTLVGVIVSDLDGFKQINDTDGHAAGDSALRQIADRLRGCTRDSDTFARIGGDEFVAILPRLDHRDTAAVIAGRMIEALKPSVLIEGRPHLVGVSAGIAVYPDDGDDIDTLFSRADAALYACKARGKNCYGYAVNSAEIALAVRPLDWDERHDLGIFEIDDQHRELVVRINRIAESARHGRDMDALSEALHELICATEQHFSDEEGFMRAVAYPHVRQHREAHQLLIKEVRSLSASIDAQSLTLTVRHLYDWLFEHIDTYDRALSHYCRRG